MHGMDAPPSASSLPIEATLQERDVAEASVVETGLPITESAARQATPGIDLDHLAEQIEAIVVTSSRPVPVKRLGQVLGLIAPTEPATVISESQVVEGEAPSQVVVKPKRSRKKAGFSVEPEKIISDAVDQLNRTYVSTGRAFTIELLAGGYRLMTIPRHRAVIAAFHGLSAQQRLSKASVETLAIIAYKQPVTRARLEAIRGVACGEVLRSLIERRLVTIVGRAEELGRPMLYGTTKGFLEAFGLSTLKDLPNAQEMTLLKRQA